MKSKVFVTGSLWSLLIYLVYNNLRDIKRTHFFFIDTGIHSSVRKNLNCRTFNTVRWDNNYRWASLYYTVARYWYRIKWPYLLYSEITGIDQGWQCQAIIGHSNYTLIEDGLSDYDEKQNPSSRKITFLQKLRFGPVYERYFGNNKLCKRIILTMKPVTKVMQEKGVVIDLRSLWNDSNKEKQDYILFIFNMTSVDVQKMSERKTLILTQPFSEDKTMSEDRKITIYREIVEQFGENNVIIKTHPREKTNYSKVFSNALVFDKIVPMQLLNFLGVKFENVATISSSSAVSFMDGTTNICFVGTEKYPEIAKIYGIVTMDTILKNK